MLPKTVDNSNAVQGGCNKNVSECEKNKWGHFSHMLLSACGAGEVAYERNGAGCFTRALVATLTKHAAALTAITYSQLIGLLPKLPKYVDLAEFTA